METYTEIEIPLSYVLAKMENKGVFIDKEKLENLKREVKNNLEQLEKEIYEIAGIRFNLNSPKQLAEILFKKLKLPPVKKTKTGYSTDAEVLHKLANLHPLPAKILEYREFFKLYSTYIEPFFKYIKNDGRIHPKFNQTGTATGRLSCSEPNLQTVPIKTEFMRKMREIISSPPEYLLISADYSQIELRILAHLSQDENLKKAFVENKDIHSETAKAIFGKEDITYEERRKAKVVNFGITYGISPYGLSKELNIDVHEAQKIIERYFNRYPKVLDWIKKVIEQAREKGYVETLLGRRRYIPEIKSDIKSVREFGERVAINMPVQGTAADLIKKAMIDIDKEFEKENIDACIILQIHDELLIEVNEKMVNKVKDIVKEKMENALKLNVPLKVEIGVGKNWAEIKD